MQDYFSVSFDEGKNRLEAKLKGFWNKEEIFDAHEAASREALAKAKPGWTMLIDLTDYQLPPQKLHQRIAQAQQALIEAGVTKTAEIVARSATMNMAVKRVVDAVGYQRQQFDTHAAAVAWLDE